MNRILINIVLLAVVAGLAYLLVKSIQEPIAFKAEKVRRQNAVVDKLLVIRKMQEFYRDVTRGAFAADFDDLKKVLTEGRFMRVRVVGDPDDPNFQGTITYDTTYKPAIDTIRALGINLDSLKYIPFGEGATFDIRADTLTYQSVLVNVVEVGTPWHKFMGPFGDPRFGKYDISFDPNRTIKFGDMTKPNLSGNWER